MEEYLTHLLAQAQWPVLALVIAACLALLGRGADWLVAEAVTLSRRSGVPTVVVGATVVSLGTTSPEAVVSVLAAVQGRPGLALGNAVGSIICDTGLILGLACLIAPLPLDRHIVNRQGWIQLACGLGLVAASVPWLDPASAFTVGGGLPRAIGFLFLGLLGLYLLFSVRWARSEGGVAVGPQLAEVRQDTAESSLVAVVKLVLSLALVVSSSWVLIPAVAEAAQRLGVPESIIAATMVAFGTSLPELVTAVTAARKGHGELAVGNIIGADILNVLFVSGAAAAATAGGLAAPAHFFTLYFPSMILVLLVFRVGILLSGSHMKKPFGFVLLFVYLGVTVLSYLVH
jgi:cation:H+ antiporter